MDVPTPRPNSQLFTVRLWEEVLGNQQNEWRGQVQHIPTGKTRYFRQWQTMIDFFLEVLSEKQTNQDTPENP